MTILIKCRIKDRLEEFNSKEASQKYKPGKIKNGTRSEDVKDNNGFI